MNWFNKNTLYLYYVVFTVNLLAIAGGMQIAWSSPVLPKISNESRLNENPLGRVISDTEGSWIGSLLNLGATFIPFLAGYSSDKIGRKYTIILISLPYIISSLILAFAKTIELYYFARVLGGFGLGATFAVVPVYVAELAEKHIRGILGTFLNILLTVGMLVSFAIGPYLSVKWFNIISSMLPFSSLVMCFFIPESPYYLIKIHKPQEAVAVMKKTRFEINPKEISGDLEDMKQYIELGVEGKISDLLTNVAMKGIIVSSMLMFFQQVCGVNSITFYAESLFAESGSDLPPEISSIIFGVSTVVATFFTPFFVDSFGRKVLFYVSGVGMLVPELALGVYFYLKEQGKDISGVYWMPVLCLTIFIFTHNLGFAPLPWIVMSEIFSENVKYYGTTLGSCFSCFMAFIMTLLFAPLYNSIGMSGSFLLFSAFNGIAIILVALYVPETRGKSFQEIQEMLRNK